VPKPPRWDRDRLKENLNPHKIGEEMTMTQKKIACLLIGILGLALAVATRAADNSAATPPAADEVLKQLIAGNEHFATNQSQNLRRSPEDFRRVAEGQNPIAIIVACADSRVSPELLFDMGVGDLFVIRVAGNVVNGAGVTVKGSIEYAIAELKVPLIVVLGHTNCGAVKAAVQHIDKKDSLPGAINGLVELIKPAAAKVKGQAGDVYDNTTRENVRIGVERLKTLEPVIAPLVKEGRVKVVGGLYDLKTGKVELLSP
jgi:carbonic anhydrase